MRTLFVRIFLSFWVAMGLILGGGILVTATLVWQRLESLEGLDPAQMAGAAAEALRSGGEAKLQQWIADTEAAEPGLTVYVLDQRGSDVLSRRLPQWLHERVEHSLTTAGRYEGRRLGRPATAADTGAALPDRPLPREQNLRSAPEIMGPEGTGYTMVFATSGTSPLALLGRFELSFTVIALALLVSGLVSLSLARFLSAPIARLQLSARALGAGNLAARVGPEISRRRDELGGLAREFDHMAERLRSLIESKETLLRDVSHELRSPLARLRVATELARRGDADIPAQLDRIERDTERLDTLIGQILQLSRLQSAEPIAVEEKVDLAALVGDIVEDAKLEASAAGKSIVWRPASMVIDGDPELLRRAVENIIRNALRFTAQGTAVEVDLAQEGATALLSVRDHGPGIPEADLSCIFEPFYRVSAARDRDSGGTGLGLAITARVASLHGGSVRAENCRDGGLRVKLLLPVSA